MSVVSSVLVEFQVNCESASGFLSVELDTELNNNRTCFLYGERVYFRVYHSEDLSISVEASDGSIFLISSDQIEEQEEDISFAKVNTATVAKLLSVLNAYSWYGTDLGSIVATGDNTIRSSKTGVAVALVNYTTKYDVYAISLSDKGLESYPVLVLVTGS